MTYGKDFYAGMPALTENQYGAGKAYQICAGFEQGLYENWQKKQVSHRW